jgi:NAD(P)-dependent dehydrogenase (short-subunit alcohol dehydrogenase family)
MRVLVTGASGGLGPAVIEVFLSGGAEVVGVARSWPSPDSRFQQISGDLSVPSECSRVIAEAGSPEIVVHIMGGFAGGKPVAETDDETWNRMLSINAGSAFNVFRAALPAMLKARRGRLIGVGSRVAAEPVAGLAAYGASKAALVHLVRTIALEVKDTGITANIVMPSTIDTEANRRAMPKANHSSWVSPKSIAGLIAWLASDEAADVNGAVIPIYGRS